MALEIREHIELRGDDPLDADRRRDPLQSLSGSKPGIERRPASSCRPLPHSTGDCLRRAGLPYATTKPPLMRRSAKRMKSESSWAPALYNLPSRR